MVELPVGTVTFFMSDLEGSTRLWEERPESMEAALVAHDAALRQAIESHGGLVIDHAGDGMAAVFASARDAVAAGIEFELQVASTDGRDLPVLSPRVALHAAEGQLRVDGRYVNQPLNRCARLLAAGHGGQILASESVASLVRGELPAGVELVGLGEQRLRDLARPMGVFQVAHARLRRDFPLLRSFDVFAGNLPLQVSAFVGRERELARTIDALHEARVVTLTGVGGVGKTRLAYQVAADVMHEHRDGVWVVELAPVRGVGGVVDAVAAVLEVTPRGEQSLDDALIEFLRYKQILLVLDNCEHVLDDAAVLAEALERSCGDVRVLVTSREGLGIDGERILAVPSLPAPPPEASVAEVADADAVRLFVQVAQARGAAFEVTSENAAAVGQVCRRLDGVPLAIELAAARVPAMNPRELAARLDDRFAVLAGGRRGRVERHQTLRATLDWSYELLDPAEQVLLARVSVFSGGWALAAAEAVCEGGVVEAGAVFSMFERLVARSLVTADDHGFQTRYRLLETVRHYGEERLAAAGATDELRQRHFDYYVTFGREISGRIFGPDQVECGRLLDVERENLLTAYSFAIDRGDPDLAFRLVASVPSRPVPTGISAQLSVPLALALDGAPEHPDYPAMLLRSAMDAAMLGDLDVASRYLEEGRALKAQRDSGEVELEWHAKLAEAQIAAMAGDFANSGAAAADAAELGRSLGHPIGRTAHTLVVAANEYAYAGEDAVATALATEGLALARQAGTPITIARGLVALAIAIAEHEPQQARALLHESLELVTRSDMEGVQALRESLTAAGRLRDWPTVLALAPRTIALLHSNRMQPGLSGVLSIVACALVASDPDASAVLLGSARRLNPPAATARVAQLDPPTAGLAQLGIFTALRREATAQLNDALGPAGHRERRAYGETLDQDHAVAFALDAIARASTS